jgi:hypothetical protein
MPPNGPLQLGTILSSPRNLDSVVCQGGPPENIHSTTQENYQYSERRQLGGESTVLLTFLNSVLGFSPGREKQETISMTCKLLETAFFQPTSQYVSTCLTSCAAKTWIKSNRSRIPLYLVTGIQIAHGAQIERERYDALDISPHSGALVAQVGLLTSPLGTTAVHGLKSATFSNNFVFAYKLQKLKISEIKNYIRSQPDETRRLSQPSTETSVTAQMSVEAKNIPIIVVPNGDAAVAGVHQTGNLTYEASRLGAPKCALPRRDSEASGKSFIVPGGEDDEDLEVQQEDVDPNEIDRPLRILSLDGGGVRGISSLLILKDIMDEIGKDEQKNHVEKGEEPVTSDENKEETEYDGTVRPCDYFDLICGTSTGGLIAIMLGRLGFVSTNQKAQGNSANCKPRP